MFSKRDNLQAPIMNLVVAIKEGADADGQSSDSAWAFFGSKGKTSTDLLEGGFNKQTRLFWQQKSVDALPE